MGEMGRRAVASIEASLFRKHSFFFFLSAFVDAQKTLVAGDASMCHAGRLGYEERDVRMGEGLGL